MTRLVGTFVFAVVGLAGPSVAAWSGIEGASMVLGLLIGLALGIIAVVRPARGAKPGRIIGAEAAVAPVLVLGLAMVSEAGLEADGVAYLVAGALTLVGLVASSFFWPLVARRIGPKHLLAPCLLFWGLLLTLLAVYQVLELPPELFFLMAPLFGATFAGLRLTQDMLDPTPVRRSQTATLWSEGPLVGPLVWLVLIAADAVPLGFLLLLGATMAAFLLLRRTEDPLYPGPGPMARVSPWGDGTGRAVPPGFRRLLTAPFLTFYLLATWALFLPMARPEAGLLAIDETRWREYLYHIPDLGQDFPRALRSLVTAPFLNHDSIQIIYVTVLLGLFGLVFEAKEGTLRTLLIFFGTTFAGALVAGGLLHAIYPELSTDRFFARAWERTWSGGSVGAFGLMGALAARAPIPWPLFAFFVFWELNVGLWFLQSYTPAFHLTALVTGFVLARYALQPETPSTVASSARKIAATGPGRASGP